MSRATSRISGHRPTSLAIAAVLMSACPGLAMQQDEDPPLLSGPTVTTANERPTLVRRDFSGEFQRLERHPAEVALDHVLDRYSVDQPTRDAIDSILSERRQALDELVIDRLDLLIKLSNGGNEQDRAEAVRALRQAMAPITRKGRLGDRIRALLPTDAATEHQRLEREYVEATIDDRIALLEAEQMQGADRGLRMRAQAIEMLVGLGAEVRGAYERTLVQKGERLDELLATLKLSPEQDGKVRAIIGQYTEKTLLNKEARDDAQARTNVFLEVAAELTPEQRRTLLKQVRGQ